MSKLKEYQSRFPAISWTEPIEVETVEGKKRWGCRVCIGEKGLKWHDFRKLWPTEASCRAHINTHRD